MPLSHVDEGGQDVDHLVTETVWRTGNRICLQVPQAGRVLGCSRGVRDWGRPPMNATVGRDWQRAERRRLTLCMLLCELCMAWQFRYDARAGHRNNRHRAGGRPKEVGWRASLPVRIRSLSLSTLHPGPRDAFNGEALADRCYRAWAAGQVACGTGMRLW